MVLLAFQAVAGTSEAGGVLPSPLDPPVPPGPGPGPITGPEGEGFGNKSDPDRDLNATFAQPLNLTGGYANNTIDPYVESSNTSYTYVTTFGNYTFPVTAPHAVPLTL